MPQQILQQPDGNWCVFSTVVDGLILVDATEEELVDWAGEEAAKNAREDMVRRIRRVKEGTEPFRRQLTYAEAKALDEKNWPDPPEA